MRNRKGDESSSDPLHLSQKDVRALGYFLNDTKEAIRTAGMLLPDDTHLEQLFLIGTRRFLGYIASRILRLREPEDAANAIFCRICSYDPGGWIGRVVDGAPGAWTGYLYTCVKNHNRNEFGREKRQKTDCVDEDSKDNSSIRMAMERTRVDTWQSNRIFGPESVVDLNRSLKELPPDRQKLLDDVVIKGKTFTQIAVESQVFPSSVQRQYEKVVEKLRDSLGYPESKPRAKRRTRLGNPRST